MGFGQEVKYLRHEKSAGLNISDVQMFFSANEGESNI